ncbi:MAG TPA: chaperonin GroEL [Chloroflexota bacterium]|nr:chaperonin GroEL [Chloroflexota bacterium]
MPDQYVLLEEDARAALRRGVNTMSRLIRCTLGPRARTVAIQPIVGTNKPPEILDDGATIARRTLQLPNPFEDIGAMIIRQLACKIGDTTGDGSATAVVIAQSVLESSIHYVAAGGNPMFVKKGIEKALLVALDALDQQARPVETPDDLLRVATACTRDPKIAGMIGEIFDIIGRDGIVLVENGHSTTIDREYVEGIQWDKGWISPYLVTDRQRMEATLENVLVCITDRFLSKADDVLPVLNLALQNGEKQLFLVAGDVSGEALATLVSNKEKNIIHTVAVKAPGYGDRRLRILEDIAVFTGASLIREDAGELVENATIGDFGRARRVWCNRDFFTVVEGSGDPIAVRKRVAQIKLELPTVTDDYERGKMRERLGKLSGGLAILKIGAPTELERDEKKLQAEDAVTATRLALESGMVAGGGAALLACIPPVQRLSLSGDEAMGAEILAQALEAPTRQILRNGGFAPNATIVELRQRPAGWAFDVVEGEMVDAWEAGIVDPLKVVRTALETGVSSALMALTTQVLIRKQKPQESMTP